MTVKWKELNIRVFGNIFVRKQKVLAQLGGIQRVLSNGGNQYLYKLDINLQRSIIIFFPEGRSFGSKSLDANGFHFKIKIQQHGSQHLPFMLRRWHVIY